LGCSCSLTGQNLLQNISVRTCAKPSVRCGLPCAPVLFEAAASRGVICGEAPLPQSEDRSVEVRFRVTSSNGRHLGPLGNASFELKLALPLGLFPRRIGLGCRWSSSLNRADKRAAHWRHHPFPPSAKLRARAPAFVGESTVGSPITGPPFVWFAMNYWAGSAPR
jgi:hypothetical protein